MIRGVAVVFGVIVIVLLVAAAFVIVVRVLDWWHRRQELRRIAARGHDTELRSGR